MKESPRVIAFEVAAPVYRCIAGRVRSVARALRVAEVPVLLRVDPEANAYAGPRVAKSRGAMGSNLGLHRLDLDAIIVFR
jgi:hypothetical protein